MPISFNFIARVQTLLLLGLPSCPIGWIVAIVRRIKGYISYAIKVKNFITARKTFLEGIVFGCVFFFLCLLSIFRTDLNQIFTQGGGVDWLKPY